MLPPELKLLPPETMPAGTPIPTRSPKSAPKLLKLCAALPRFGVGMGRVEVDTSQAKWRWNEAAGSQAPSKLLVASLVSSDLHAPAEDKLPRSTSFGACSDTTAHTFAPPSPRSPHSQVSESVLFEQTKRMMSLHGCRPKSSAEIVGQKPFILEAKGIDSFGSLDWEPPSEDSCKPRVPLSRKSSLCPVTESSVGDLHQDLYEQTKNMMMASAVSKPSAGVIVGGAGRAGGAGCAPPIFAVSPRMEAMSLQVKSSSRRGAPGAWLVKSRDQ